MASQGVVRRDAWEEAYDRVVRRLDLGVPIIPIDGLTRRDFRPDGFQIDVELKTNKPNNIFAPGDEMVIIVTNRSNRAVHVELIGTSSQGKKALRTPGPIEIAPGHEYRDPPDGYIPIREELGKEQITLYASETSFPAGALLRGQDVADRFVHPLFTLRRGGKQDAPQFEETRLLKKTIAIETR